MRRRIAIILGLFVGCISFWGTTLQILQAENVEHENILHVNYGGMWQQDQYLSPLLYSGMRVGLGNEWWQPFRQESRLGRKGRLTNWVHTGRVDVSFGWLYNQPHSNGIYALGIQGGWGALYKWQFQQAGVQIWLGPYLDLDFMPRMILSNVNKPYSMDAAAQIEAMAGISYSFAGRKTSYRLRYTVRANVIGVDFMPDYWQSYYELTEGIDGIVRCAGMWNHRYLNHELTLDMQFLHSTWRVGVRHEYLEYGQSDMWFSREQISAVVGTCFRYKLKPNKRLTEW